MSPGTTTCIAFEGLKLIATGPLAEVVKKTKRVLERGPSGSVLIFDTVTSDLVELDFRGSLREILARFEQQSAKQPTDEPSLASGEPRGPGRPKLGVVAREVTLLPRHWEWLNAQPGGASVALRKLVEDARRARQGVDRRRRAQEVTYRFLHAIAGDLPGFEETTRALFAGEEARFHELMAGWPSGIRDHAAALATSAFAQS
jgi:hypothetical protein